MTEIIVADVSAAIALCKEYIGSGTADIFRGQSHPWPMSPGFFRQPNSKEDNQAKLREFMEWMKYTPRLLGFDQSIETQTAVAQHYGIPTQYLDVTSSPEVAAFFALDGSGPPDSDHAVIYAGRRTDIAAISGCKWVQIEVPNLWRLEAQHGEFIRLEHSKCSFPLTAAFTKILFPRTPALPLSRDAIYPSRKSDLEVVLDQYFYRDQIERTLSEITNPSQLVVRRKRQTYPGAYPKRAIPGPNSSWLRLEHQWIVPRVESVEIASNPTPISLSLDGLSSIGQFNQVTETQLGPLIDLAWSEKSFLKFQLQWTGATDLQLMWVNTGLTRYWDGLRLFPFESAEVRRSVLSAVAFCAGPYVLQHEDDEEFIGKIVGETTIVEFAPTNGHISAGSVGTKRLSAAVSAESMVALQPYYRKKAETNPLSLLDFVTNHLVVFDCGRFRSLFVEELLPTALSGFVREAINNESPEDEKFWPMSFDPINLGFFTTAQYGITSQFSLEPHIERLIVVTSDMTDEELRDEATSATHWFFENRQTMALKFHGYNRDPRELWEIPNVKRRAKQLQEVGTMSLLEPFMHMRTGDEPNDVRSFHRRSLQGLGSFEVWSLAQGTMKSIQGKTLAEMPTIMRRFWNALMKSNAASRTLYLSTGGNADNVELAQTNVESGWE